VPDLDLAFLSKITASMTHELKNALAIIQESAGLMSDILSLAQKTPFPHQEKFHKVISTIDQQVRRGVEISTRLNRFAHSMDHPLATIELNHLLDQTAFLLRRFAQRKKLELTVQASPQEIMVDTDPFRLQMILADGIEHLAELLEPGARLILTARPAGLDINIFVAVHGDKTSEWPGMITQGAILEKLSHLRPVLEHLRGRLEPVETPEYAGLKVILPVSVER
jgi:signal transduction histidine kinase